MKLSFFYFLAGLAMMSFRPPAQKNQFVLNGTINGHEQEWIYITYTAVDGRNFRDSTLIKGHRFSFNGILNQPSRAYIMVKPAIGEKNNGVIVFIEPRVMTISLEQGAFDKAVLKGSATQLQNMEVQEKLNKIRGRWKTVLDTVMAIGKRDNFKFQEYKNWLLVPYFDERRDVNLSFVTSHPDSWLSAELLGYCIYDLGTDSLRNLFGSLSPRVQQSVPGKNLAAELDKRKVGIPGKAAALFVTKDINGQELGLASFKGKYVLLDFWASWCLPCRKLNPHLKELYARYREKGFEVIGVASDDNTPDAWRKAVKDDGLPWLHVLQGDIGRQYNITLLPTQVLIDPSGTIIARYGGVDGEDHGALDGKLEKVFK
ncbi:MAG: AhpC/TSA family protein [Bacteroidetes bacterium]|nr:AhpC/TSA family protein [Bacteroidota bacterium]